VIVGEETEAHVILPAISTAVYNQLARDAENLPGLVLRPGRRRVYPFGAAACQVIGRLALVSPGQMQDDPNAHDELRRYHLNDEAGQSGVEGAYEQSLRGARGAQLAGGGEDDSSIISDPVAGKDVSLTLDIQLQAAIEQAFAKRRVFTDPNTGEVAEIRQDQPGAAVVIDVASGRVLAMASYPTFDLNMADADYRKLSLDEIRQPLLNRALHMAAEPGSTVKPLMALGALSDGLVTPETTIECTGYLILKGQRFAVGRCWTMKEYKLTHHDIPASDPLPTNSLTVVDAIERSCDVYFETVADWMGMTRERYWYDRFGLGRPTGVGLPETTGRIPNPVNIPRALLREQTWFAGIGQGPVMATPMQMANAVATIARDGVWMQPELIEGQANSQTRVDLGFSAVAMAAVKRGMWAVVNKDGGTAKIPHGDPPDEVDRIVVAGKTGTSQVPPMSIVLRDEQGRPVMEDGQVQYVRVNPELPEVRTWYIGGGTNHDQYAHHWLIGYAPADHPQVAFAVFAEYGGSGGPVATSIARDVLAACVKQGYLH
jgi:penicillin-binding protein 2